MNIKKILAAALFALFALAPLASADYIPPEAPEGYVLDAAEVLSEETEAALEAQFATLNAETSTQIAIFMATDLQGYTVEEAALTVARTWGLGQEEFNNGVLLLVAPNESMARIEVGYGLEGAITDAQANAILNVMIPYFMATDYDAAVLEGAGYLEGLARGEEFPLEEVTLDANNNVVEEDGTLYILLLFYAGLFIWAVLSWMSRTKAWWIGGVFGLIIGAFVSISIFTILLGGLLGLLLDLFLSTVLYKKLGRASKGGFWGGFIGSGRSGGGGFGGFGGGGFGGGGSSGSW